MMNPGRRFRKFGRALSQRSSAGASPKAATNFAASLVSLACNAGCSSSGSKAEDGGRDVATLASDAGETDARAHLDTGIATHDSGPILTDTGGPGEASTFEAGPADARAEEAGKPDGGAGASSLELHLHATRDGAYTDALVTKAAAAATHVDSGFTGTVTGTIYGQPLFVDGWKSGQDAVFVATDQNHITALNAATGAVLWDVTLGPPVVQSTTLACGTPYKYYGSNSTPVIDLASRTLYAESFQTPTGSTTPKHYIYALSIDTGATRSGWPVDVAARVTGFSGPYQQDRGALTVLNGTVYVPYAGLNGDCGAYHGWVVGVSTTDPANVAAYSTAAGQGGIWGAVSSDGANLYAVTGNTSRGTTIWGGGEAVLHFGSGPTFSGANADYFTPSNWEDLDTRDADLGSSAVVLFDLPGATPSTLAAAMGKAGVVHLLNRADLGGLGTGDGTAGEGLFSLAVTTGQIKGTGASYESTKGRYVLLRAESNISVCPNNTSGDLLALTVTPTAPPTLVPAWCASSGGKGSPVVTTTNGMANPLVWVVSTGGTNQLEAFDGDTGASVFAGGGTANALGTIQHWTSPVEAKGRFYVGGTNAVSALTTQ